MIDEKARKFLFDHVKASLRFSDDPRYNDYVDLLIDKALDSLSETDLGPPLPKMYEKVLSAVSKLIKKEMEGAEL